MQVTKNITLDLLETGSPVIIKAKQNDRNTRYISAHLYVDGLAYPVPNGTEIAFRYKKPDGTAGFYDTLPDNSPAITVSGNTVTVELVEQVLTVSGCVHCEINMYNATSEKLTTFTFEIAVEESVLTDAEIISSDYYNALTAEIAKALQAVTDATEQAENAAQSAQDAADSAAMSKDWAAGQPVTYSGAPVSIAYAGAQRIASITAYGENAQGGTTEAPVALTGVDSVHVCGRNLLPNKATTGIVHGVSYTVNTDGSITAKGTATTWAPIVFTPNLSLPAGTYTLTAGALSSGTILVIARNLQSEGSIVMINGGSKTFSIAEAIENYIAFISVAPGNTVDFVCYPMLNLGSTALPYEPYRGSVTPLPIPRALHEVGDVRDVCRTRVKSVYDKRIVLDGTENWTEYTDENWQGAGYHVYRFYDADALLGQPIVSNKYPSRRGSSSFKGTLGVASGGQSILFSVVEQKTVEDWKAYLAAQKAAGTPLIIYRQSTAYNGTNGLDVCLTEYQTGFVEIDGETVRGSYAQNGERPYGVVVSPSTIVSPESLICSNANVENQNLNWGYVYAAHNPIKDFIFGLIGSDITSTTELNAYFAAQKAAGTPVQVAYQLAAPEVYATDPVDFDNTAGPLTVMTGGELEVRMTELIGTRSDVSNNTVAFTETAQDADIQTGEKLSVLFGKIKKRFAVIASNLSNIYNKTESDERYATAAQGEKADNALPETGGTISGNLTVVQDLTVQRAFNGMRIKAGVKIITTPTTSARAELFNSDTLNTLFGTTGVSYTNGNCVVLAANGDYDFHPRVVTSGYVNSKWAVFTADAGNFTISTMRVNYIAIKFA